MTFTVALEPKRAKRIESSCRLKILYIAGWGRSGSTLLDNLLGQLPGFFSTGELRYIWERGVIGGWTCGCGELVKSCDVWSRVLSHLAEDDQIPEARTVLAWQQRVTRFRHTARLLALDEIGPADPILALYADVVTKLYERIVDVTGASVIVDSSKRPSDAAVLALIPNIDLYVVQLVRDPRAVAYSWQQRQPGIDRHGVAASTGSWVAWNVACEGLRRRLPGRSMLIRYEDFVQDPRKKLKAIADLLGERRDLIEDSDSSVFMIGSTHTVSGNPARFKSGAVEVRPDTRWKTSISPWQRWSASAIALPLLRRYGYRIASA